MQLSPAQRHSARIAAERLLRQQQSLDSETSLHVQIAALEKDVAAAAAISNRAERMEFKRDVLLPRWMPTAQTWLESDSMHQNPVFAWCVIWLFDTGQFDQALDWADVAIERGQETPAAFGSAFPVFVADTVLAWAETEAAQGQDVEPYFSRTLGNVMQHWNMYEVIKAKYVKFAGLHLLRDENGEVERTLLFIGTGTKNVGKTLAVNAQSDFNALLGEGNSPLKSDVLAALANAGQNWWGFIHVLAADSESGAWVDAVKAAQVSCSVEGVVLSDDVAAKEQITASALLPVKATGTGGAYNLAPGYYRILPVAVDGISHVASEENWLTVPGADEESDDELRERCRNQFNLVGNYHTDAVYRSMIAGVAGLSIDRIFFEHEAPRGPGTANAYLLLDSGVASAPFVDAVNDYINTQGHHGHGDDMQCYAMPETLHDLAVTVWVRNLNNISDDEQKRLKDGIENLIRCAFRENTDYDVRRTWPYSRFSFSQLGREIHKNFPVTESLNFSLDDIASELNVPRLKSLVVSIENE